MSDIEPLKEKTTQLLTEARRTGLLTEEEFTWRAGHLTHATSVGELEVLVRDLLVDDATSPAPLPLAGVEVIAILGSRKVTAQGLGIKVNSVSILGSTELDYRQFAFSEKQSLELEVILGETVLWLPPGVRVRLQAVPILGEVSEDPVVAGNGPFLDINAVIILGSLRIRRG